MKIFIHSISNKFQPGPTKFIYPSHNKTDYGVEQDFFIYLNNHPELLTTNPDDADWHYIPVFWTRWHMNHDFAKYGIDELQEYVDQIIPDYKKNFTICQYADGPIVKLKQTIFFLASRNSSNGLDIPTLSALHRFPFFTPSKKYRASFVGRIHTHPIRLKIAEQLKGRNDILIKDGDFGSRFFVKTIMQSRIVLAPRGYGGSSFRFYEAMQLKTVPFLIGDIDTRPFKKYIPWDEMSFYTSNVEELIEILDGKTDKELEIMGSNNYTFFLNNLTYQKWCPYVIKELDDIT